jgi:hypothetical protein
MRKGFGYVTAILHYRIMPRPCHDDMAAASRDIEWHVAKSGTWLHPRETRGPSPGAFPILLSMAKSMFAEKWYEHIVEEEMLNRSWRQGGRRIKADGVRTPTHDYWVIGA